MILARGRHGEALRDQAREQALERLAKGEDPAKVIERMAHQLANRFMHQPTLAIRDAASQENHELLNAAPRLLLPPKPAFEQPAPPVKRQKDDTPA